MHGMLEELHGNVILKEEDKKEALLCVLKFLKSSCQSNSLQIVAATTFESGEHYAQCSSHYIVLYNGRYFDP